MAGVPDAVIVGLGWAGGILAAELTRAGLSVVALERGPQWSRADGDFEGARDEMLARRRVFMQDVTLETVTLRHHDGERALPIRSLGAFTPGTGVGGSSLLYGGAIRRLDPWELAQRSNTVERFGADVLPDDTTLADWGIGYDDLAPDYARFEQVAGVAGGVGVPLTPAPPSPAMRAFTATAGDLGLNPFATPTATATGAYVNPYGLSRPACDECGFCLGVPCRSGAKGDASTTVIPAALRTGRLRIVPEAYVFEVLHDGARAYGVRYHDADGVVREQRAGLVILTAYALNNTRLLLLSGMGTPYDPRRDRGAVGRNPGMNLSLGIRALFADRTWANHVGAGARAVAVDDFAAERNDPRESGFVGGIELSVGQPGSGPIAGAVVPPGTPRFGPAFKRALREWFDHDVVLSARGQALPYRGQHLDLDPTYTDRYGHPLLRLTFDWRPNERRMAHAIADRLRDLARAMGADHVVGRAELEEHFDTVRYQGTHNTGGAIMGTDPARSVVDPWLRLWDFANVWVVGGSAIPQSSALGPTGTIGALAFRAARDVLAVASG